MKCETRIRKTCRLCGAADFEPVVQFANMPFTDEFVSRNRIGEEFTADIRIFWCKACRSAQNLCDVHVAEYYREYQYTVSASPFARNFMSRLAEESFQRFNFQRGDRVIEIGSGDGIQLKCFQELGASVLGFEPSDSLTVAARAEGIPTIQTLFNCEGIEQIPSEMGPAQVVLLTYTFDHLPDPKLFLELVKQILDPERGVLLIEVHDFAKIVERREICLFEHEHSVYLTALTMERLLRQCGFRLISTDLLSEQERRGNSLLVAAVPVTNTCWKSTFTPTAADLALERIETIQAFDAQVQAGIKRLWDHVFEQKRNGKKVAGYGAGGRGVMTLAMAGLKSGDIEYLCDQNSGFHGLYTPSTHIPVVPPSHVEQQRVDEIIVFSYGYMNEIKSLLHGFLERGGRISSMLEFL